MLEKNKYGINPFYPEFLEWSFVHLDKSFIAIAVSVIIKNIWQTV